MCDLFLQNYSSALNLSNDPTTDDLIPTMILFSDFDCKGVFHPVDATTGGFTNGTYPIGSLFPTPFHIAGIYIPFNVGTVQVHASFLGIDYTTTFRGPFLSGDLRLINWEDTVPLQTPPNPDMYTTIPIETLEIVFQSIWNDLVLSMCDGQVHNIGPYTMTRYQPQGERCDYFIPNQYCTFSNYLETKEICGCFLDLGDIERRSVVDGVNLPVLCFGQHCANERSYRSAAILAKDCHFTLCQQIIDTAEAFQGQATVFCGGHFFDTSSSVSAATIIPSVSALNGIQPDTPADSGISYVVWVVVAVVVVLIGILAYFMFKSRNTSQVSPEQNVVK